MEEKKKSNAGLIVLVVILLLACVGMGSFIFINKDKIMSKENATTTNSEKKETETTNKTEKEEVKDKTEATSNTIETRNCIGTYSGQGAVTQDPQTGQNTNGTITIDLKEDGTYKLTKSGMEQYWSGNYTIIENALLLKTMPGPGPDTSAKYSYYLNISNDCSTISWGYGSVFIDPNFTLTKSN